MNLPVDKNMLRLICTDNTELWCVVAHYNSDPESDSIPSLGSWGLESEYVQYEFVPLVLESVSDRNLFLAM